MGKKSSKPAIPTRLPNAVQKVVSESQALDLRRQHQIHNQIGAINRVLAGWQGDTAWTYDDEMAELHRHLANTQGVLRELVDSLRELYQGQSEEMAAELHEAIDAAVATLDHPGNSAGAN